MAEIEKSSSSETAQLAHGLTPAEDDELRRLHWLSQISALAGRKLERLLELRLRDRRDEIRPPREVEHDAAFSAMWDRFHFRNAVSRTVPTVELADKDEPPTDLPEVRRQLEQLHRARLLTPLSRADESRYKRLLTTEQSLLRSRDS